MENTVQKQSGCEGSCSKGCACGGPAEPPPGAWSGGRLTIAVCLAFLLPLICAAGGAFRFAQQPGHQAGAAILGFIIGTLIATTGIRRLAGMTGGSK